MNTPTAACADAFPAFQAALTACGFVFNSAGAPSLPTTVNQQDLLVCMCTPSTLAIFQATVADCVSNAGVTSILNPVVSACAAASGGAGGPGPGSGPGTITTCSQTLDSGINRITSCGVRFDAAGNPLQTATTDPAIMCVCTASNLAVFKTAQSTCSYNGFQNLVQVCESGLSFECVAPASSDSSAAGGGVLTVGSSASAVASAGSSSGSPRATGSGSQTVAATTSTGTTAVPTKSGGGFSMHMTLGMLAAVGLLI
ncbi:hypothetical protein HDU81_003464 [Chytriomyces hyalinus]|nr:hypothetical protein HDU81_003464 [Chytriomyces hyalinus]